MKTRPNTADTRSTVHIDHRCILSMYQIEVTARQSLANNPFYKWYLVLECVIVDNGKITNGRQCATISDVIIDFLQFTATHINIDCYKPILYGDVQYNLDHDQLLHSCSFRLACNMNC